MPKYEKIDPTLAVKDVNKSCEWYQTVFACKRTHGGNDFAVLVNYSKPRMLANRYSTLYNNFVHFCPNGNESPFSISTGWAF